jgi:hypothetical protein
MTAPRPHQSLSTNERLKLRQTHHFLVALTVQTVLCTMRLLVPDRVLAHCDGMDDPVVQEAGRAYVQAYSEFMPYSL